MKLNEFIVENKILETRTPDQILLELNVINTKDIDRYLNDIASNLHDKNLVKWFIDRGKKFLINSEENNVVVTQFSTTAEPWMKKAQKRGDTLYRFQPMAELRVSLDHVVDYINALTDTVTGAKQADQQTQSRAVKALKGLQNTSLPQAMAASVAWTDSLNKRAEKKRERGELTSSEEEGLELVMKFDDLTWVKLTQKGCLDREGQVMGHCVASYWDKVKGGNTVIYSLRDTENNPHATVEVSRGELVQVKGKQNKPPVEKYQPATIKLLNTLNVPPTSAGMNDIQRMNFMFNKVNNKYGTIKDVGFKTYDKNNIEVYQMEQEIDIHTRPYVYFNNKPMTYKDTGYHRASLKTTEHIEDFATASVPGTDKKADILDSYSLSLYKMAKFLSNLQYGSKSIGYDTALKDYIVTYDSNDTIALAEDKYDQSVSVTKDGNLYELYFVGQAKMSSFDTEQSDSYIVLQNKSLIRGQMYLSKTEDGRNVLETYDSRSRTGTVADEIVFNEYFKKQKTKNKPFVNLDGLTNHPETMEIIDGRNPGEQVKPTYKNEFFEFTETVGISNDEPCKRIHLYMKGIPNLLTVKVSGYNGKPGQGEWDQIHKEHDEIREFTRDDEVINSKEIRDAFCEIVNKADLLQFYTSSDTLDKLDDVGIYYNNESVKLTTDTNDIGAQFSDEQENGFRATKTQKTLKMFYNDNLIIDCKLYAGNTIGEWDVQDQLSVFQNSQKIADVLNFYNLRRGHPSDTQMSSSTTNKDIAASGISYTKNEEWRGMKQGPKSADELTKDDDVKEQYSNKDWEIFKFKDNWLLKEKNSSNMIATLITKGRMVSGDENRKSKETNVVTIDFNKTSREDISKAIDAAQFISFDNISVGIDQDNPNTFLRRQGQYVKQHDDLVVIFKDELYKKGLYISSNSFVKSDREEPRTISKGPGGTWVQEEYAPCDFSIRYVLNDISATRESSSWNYEEKLNDNDRFIDKHLGRRTISPNTEGYTLYLKSKPVLRVKMPMSGDVFLFYRLYDYDPNSLQQYKINALNTKEELDEFMPQIQRLYNSVKVLPLSKQLKELGYYNNKGQLANLQDDPKLKGFMDGLITYEDGTQWVSQEMGYYNNNFARRRDYHKKAPHWILKRPDDKGELKEIIAVDIGEGGIEEIQIAKSVRNRIGVYMPFLNDLVDINDKVY